MISEAIRMRFPGLARGYVIFEVADLIESALFFATRSGDRAPLM
jgi:hypothetical protein